LRSRFKSRWVAGLLLPAILFRALIPVGFMPALDGAGAMSVHFCDGMVQAPADKPAKPGHELRKCPYAASSSPAPPLAFIALSPDTFVVRPVQAFLSGRAAVPTIVRVQAPRAPPALG
jgi:hypothetical protein